MSDGMVRCVRCHGVFEADLDVCPRCGTTYRPMPVAPAPEAGFYVDKYHGTEFAAPVAPTATPVMPATGPRSGMIVAMGVMMVALALVVGGLFALGAFGSAAPAPALIFGNSQRPSPTPTLPPSVTTTLAQLRDINLSAHIKIQTRATVDARISGGAKTVIANMDATVSSGNEMGTLTVGGTATQFRLVDGIYYSRAAPGGKWAAKSIIPPAMLLTPLFGITDAKMIQFIGEEKRSGQPVNHLRSTGWWVPDQSRMSLFDVNVLGIKANKTVLDLWATPDGNPVAAAFAATQDTSDGSVHLLDIEVSFAFDSVGTPQIIENPIPTPSPKASPS